MYSKVSLIRMVSLVVIATFVLASCGAPGLITAPSAPVDQAVAQAETATIASSPAAATASPTAAETTTSSSAAATATPSSEADVIATPSAEGDITSSTITPPVATPGGKLPGNVAIELVKVADGFVDPINVASPPDGTGRLFVVERPGRIMIVEDGKVQKEPFLDIKGNVLSAFLEQGLYDMVFHPNFKENGLFYIHYAELLRNGDSLIVQYQVSKDNPNKADPESAKAILHVEQPYANHNGGELAFGPDGYLYIGIGDGGWEGDPLEAGQNLSTLLGKLLRIDVNAQGKQDYAIPDDNPFNQNIENVELFGISELEFARNHPEARPEIWAWGLRNPWKFNFDSKTGDLYIADVGQNHWEEINFQPADSGGGENYGWDFLQGSHCFPIDEKSCPSVGVLPVAEYSHDHGCAVVGIGVYRGEEFPELDGIYFSGDYCSGHVWGLARNPDAAETGQWIFQELLDTDLRLTGSGQDEDGNLYATSCECHYGGAGATENPPGALWRIMPADQVPQSAETAPTGGSDDHEHEHNQ
jgi:glucose/arabinose dehydrogenase